MRLCKTLYFVVTEGASKELQFDNGNLVEHVEVVFVAPVQHKFEEAASNAEVNRFQFT